MIFIFFVEIFFSDYVDFQRIYGFTNELSINVTKSSYTQHFKHKPSPNKAPHFDEPNDIQIV
jgi:hypothetical protein